MFLPLNRTLPQTMHGAGGGGGDWISGLVGGIGAGAGVRGENRQVNSKNKYYGQMFGPEMINAYARGFAPWLWDAIEGKKGTTGFQGDLYNLAQGKDISPWLLNKPLADLGRGATQNLSQFQSQVGRNNSGGGLSNFAALANKATLGGQRSNLMNQYGQWREQQRRSDLDWLMNSIRQSQGQGFQSSSNIADRHQFKKNFLQKLSAFGAGYAGAQGGGANSQQLQQQPQVTSTSNPGFAGSSNYGAGGANNYGFGYNPGGNTSAGNNYGFNYNPNYSSSIQTGR